MFDSITLRGGQSSLDSIIDLGTFAEALLFYQKVLVILDRGSVTPFIKAVGVDNLRTLIKKGFCSVTFFRDMTGVHGQPIHGSSVEELELVAMELAGGPGKRLRDQEQFTDPFVRLKDPDLPIGKIERLVEVVSIQSISDLRLENVGPLEAARADLDDKKYLKSAITDLLGFYVPEYISQTTDRFDIKSLGQKFQVDTNLDFAKLNGFYHQRISPTHSSITPAYLIAHLLTARQNLSLAAKYGSDLVTSNISSHLLQLRVQRILERRNANAAKLSRFDDLILAETKSLREAINSGNLNFNDFLKLLDEAQKFKHWLKDKPLEADLVDSYYKEITAKGFVDKLPVRATRFSIFTLIGLGLGTITGPIGIAAGVGLGVLDSFILDSMIRGWKPDQFVEGSLRKVLERHS